MNRTPVFAGSVTNAQLQSDIALAARLRDERFILPFNPLAGPGFRIPGPRPDPAPFLR